jgi:predicted RNA polymerase sigma factor
LPAALAAEETDWAQIVEWYDEPARLTDSPAARLNARRSR